MKQNKLINRKGILLMSFAVALGLIFTVIRYRSEYGKIDWVILVSVFIMAIIFASIIAIVTRWANKKEVK